MFDHDAVGSGIRVGQRIGLNFYHRYVSVEGLLLLLADNDQRDGVPAWRWVGVMGGLTVLDVSDAEQPIRLGTLTFPEGRGAGSICTEGDRVYTANGLQPMQIVDATDPAAPVLLGSVTPAKFVAAVYARNSILYSAHNLNGLGISDVTEPAQATFGGLTSLPTSGPPRAVGQRIYVPVMNGLAIRRYEWPTDLEPLGAFETGGMVRAVEAAGDLHEQPL